MKTIGPVLVLLLLALPIAAEGRSCSDHNAWVSQVCAGQERAGRGNGRLCRDRVRELFEECLRSGVWTNPSTGRRLRLTRE